MDAKELEILFESHHVQSFTFNSGSVLIPYNLCIVYLPTFTRKTNHSCSLIYHTCLMILYMFHFSWLFPPRSFPQISCFEKSFCQVASDSALQGKKLQRSSASSSNEPSLPLATSRVGRSGGKVNGFNANTPDGCIYVTSNDVSRTYLSFSVF